MLRVTWAVDSPLDLEDVGLDLVLGFASLLDAEFADLVFLARVTWLFLEAIARTDLKLLERI